MNWKLIVIVAAIALAAGIGLTAFTKIGVYGLVFIAAIGAAIFYFKMKPK